MSKKMTASKVSQRMSFYFLLADKNLGFLASEMKQVVVKAEDSEGFPAFVFRTNFIVQCFPFIEFESFPVPFLEGLKQSVNL